MGRLNLPYRLPLPGFYIEPGEGTPPGLRAELERSRAATILPIPYRPAARMDDLREAALRDTALEIQERTGRRLRP